MQSPPAEWALGISYLVVLDLIRDRGEPDGDTLSECVRDLVGRHPLGSHALALGIAWGGWAFHRHIVRPLRLT